MKLLKGLFGSGKPELGEHVVKRSCFSVEFYPLTNRYYPKYKNYYMGTRWATGIVELKEDYLFSFADYGNTEAEADKLIAKFKEQQLKENVRTIEK